MGLFWVPLVLSETKSLFGLGLVLLIIYITEGQVAVRQAHFGVTAYVLAEPFPAPNIL